MKKYLLVVATLLSVCVSGQTNYKVTAKHTLEIDNILRMSEYNPWDVVITVNYGIWRGIVPTGYETRIFDSGSGCYGECQRESGWILFDNNNKKYLIKKSSPYYKRIEDSFKVIKNRAIIH